MKRKKWRVLRATAADSVSDVKLFMFHKNLKQKTAKKFAKTE
jgi:hypothetical protein